ncbi:MAG: terpene cyclase/mutase family protein, partial [Planctomycetota bacterium]|nr:terpene cyclase/mutase family protein [Planctomycetota bacterium]
KTETETAIEAALDWLSRHQSNNGGWDADGFSSKCKGENPCKNDLGASPYFDVAITGLVIAAFRGHGNTHQKGDFKETVQKGLDYLLKNQDGEGWLGKTSETHEWIYNHALATMALCEVYAVTQDENLKKPCEKAVACILKAQNQDLAWRYEPQGGENDTSVTGCMILALKCAKTAGIDIPQSVWEGALKWFDRCTDPTTGRVGYIKPGDLGSVIRGVNEHYEKLPTMTAVAVVSRILCGQSLRDPSLKKSADFLMEHLPQRDEKGLKVDPYYWYWGTHALFQYGGDNWTKWYETVKKVLLESQCKEKCAKGSWNPVGKWDMVGGRVYSTALSTLTLEMCHRYETAMKNK